MTAGTVCRCCALALPPVSVNDCCGPALALCNVMPLKISVLTFTVSEKYSIRRVAFMSSANEASMGRIVLAAKLEA